MRPKEIEGPFSNVGTVSLAEDFAPFRTPCTFFPFGYVARNYKKLPACVCRHFCVRFFFFLLQL